MVQELELVLTHRAATAALKGGRVNTFHPRNGPYVGAVDAVHPDVTRNSLAKNDDVYQSKADGVVSKLAAVMALATSGSKLKHYAFFERIGHGK